MPAASPSDVWSQTLATLKLQMTRPTFDAWLSRTWLVEQEGSEWVIGVPSPSALDWLSHHLAPLITRTLSWTAREPATVRFVLGVEAPRPAGAAEAEGDLPDWEVSLADDASLAGETSPPGEASTAAEAGPALDGLREERASVGDGGVLVWTDFYIKLKVAFRKRALRELKGARLSVFLCLSLHVDRNGIAKPGGIETIMHETAYSRGAVCSALEYLQSAGLISRLRQHRGADQYQVLGYAWFGQKPAPALWEPGSKK